MNNEYRVGIYLRLSREDIRCGESGSISTQRDLLLNYIKDNNLNYVDEYVDDGVSGLTFDRAGFNRLIKDIENKRINMVITKDTSRLGRDHIEFGYYVERYFPEHRVRYVALNDGIDTFLDNGSNDMLVFKSAFNDMYVKDISNKQRSALHTKKRSGLFVGAYAPYGYRKLEEDKHKLVINEEEALVVKRIFNLFANGKSLTSICKILTSENIKTPSISKGMNIGQYNYHYGVWSIKTVSDILHSPNYIGNLTQCRQTKVSYKSKKRIHNKSDKWVVVKNAIPRIIDDNLFELVQNMFANNKYRSKGNIITNNLLLKGMVYCKDCGHTIGFKALHYNIKSGEVCKIYGNCNYYLKRKSEGVCSPHSISYTLLEETILKEIKKHLNNINRELLKGCIKKEMNLDKNVNKCEVEILKLININKIINKKIDDCYNDKLEGNITLETYKRISNNFISQIKANTNKINEYNAKIKELNSQENENYIMNKINKLLDIDNLSRTLIVSLIDKIYIGENNNIEIYYRFKL